MSKVGCIFASMSKRHPTNDSSCLSRNPPFGRVLCLRRGWRCEPCPERPEESLPCCAPSSRVRQPSSVHPRPCCLSLQKYNRDLRHGISELLSCWASLRGQDG